MGGRRRDRGRTRQASPRWTMALSLGFGGSAQLTRRAAAPPPRLSQLGVCVAQCGRSVNQNRFGYSLLQLIRLLEGVEPKNIGFG